MPGKKAVQQKQRRTLYQRMHIIPKKVGLIVCVALMVISIPLGNYRELSKHVVKATATLQVEGLLVRRAQQATNMLSVANRYPALGEEERIALRAAQASILRARSAHDQAESDHALTFAMGAMVEALYSDPGVTEADRRSILAAADFFNQNGTEMKIQVREYNRLIAQAIETYDMLPTKFLFQRPVLFD